MAVKKMFVTILLCLQLTGVFCDQMINSNQFLFNNNGFDFIDLTHTFDSNTIYWPDSKNFTFENVIARYERDGSWYASNDFCAGEHGGTHLDAPYHFSRRGKFADQIPLNNLILPLIIADVSDKVKDNPNFILQKHHLDYMLNNYFGNVNQPCLIIFKFGWSKYFSDRQQYLGIKEGNANMNFPGISAEVAHWIASSYKNVVGVGVDVASADPGAAEDAPAHKALLSTGLYILENVKLDQYLPEAQCTALVLPMKIGQGSGAPLRLVAICPKNIISK